jgi:hypothetical protein
MPYSSARVSEENAAHVAMRHRDCESSIQRNDEGSKMSRAKVYASVWDALADTPERAANLRARADLMQQFG